MMRSEIRRSLAFTNPLLLSIADVIMNELSGGYIGVHFRLGDGINAGMNVRRICWDVVCGVLKLDAGDVLEVERMVGFDGLDSPPPPQVFNIASLHPRLTRPPQPHPKPAVDENTPYRPHPTSSTPPSSYTAPQQHPGQTPLKALCDRALTRSQDPHSALTNGCFWFALSSVTLVLLPSSSYTHPTHPHEPRRLSTIIHHCLLHDYAHLVLPKPFVLLSVPFAFFLDTRIAGSKSLFIRNGCKPGDLHCAIRYPGTQRPITCTHLQPSLTKSPTSRTKRPRPQVSSFPSDSPQSLSLTSPDPRHKQSLSSCASSSSGTPK